MWKRTLLIILFFGISFCLLGQTTTLSGIIIDKKNKNPLAFATVKTNTGFTTLTDSEGKFYIHTKRSFTSITVSYVGYQNQTLTIKKPFIRVLMTTSIEKLKEVIITAKKSPALILMEKVIRHKAKNNIEKALKSFKFNSYNKIIVTANPDSIQPTIDSVFIKKNGKKTFLELDSTNYEFHKEIKDKHLYIAEKISEIKFKKGKKRKEVVLASRMAGLKNPIYEVLALTLQNFSAYDEQYTVMGTKYLNPASKKGLKFYRYKILDTVNQNNRKLISVHFMTKKKREKASLEGVLYIDKANDAIAKTIYELKGIIHIKASQEYAFFKEKNIWFPTNQTLYLKKGKNTASIGLFGGALAIKFQKKNDSIVRKKRTHPADVSYLVSKTYNSNIELNQPVKLRNSAIRIDVSEATNKKPVFWNQFRKDSLSNRDKRAYIYVDSIAEKEGINEKIHLGRKMISGYYPTKYMDIDLGQIIKYNSYEGFRIGFGGVTNENVSKTFRFSSYVAYGFRDHAWKHQHKIAALLHQKKNTWLIGAYTNDIKESGLFAFENQNSSALSLDFLTFSSNRFFNHKTFSLQLKHDVQPNLEMTTSWEQSKITPLFPIPLKNQIRFNLNRWKLGFSYEPFNEYMLTPLGKQTLKNGYPKFLFHTEKAFGDFSFWKINTQITHRLKWGSKNITYMTLQGGWTEGTVPVTHLYSSNSNYTFDTPWVKRISFERENYFETMAWGEFFSDRFVSFHLEHYLHPKFSVITRGTWGIISNTQPYENQEFKSLEKGYFESGLSGKSLFYGFGIGCFYRYGYYQNPNWYDNLSVKLNFRLQLGF